MNTNKNSYTIIYASVLVIVVAFLLAFVSSSLKPTQDQNVALDKKKQILAAVNIRGLQSAADVEAKYNEVVASDMVVKADGSVVKEGKSKDKDGFKVENKDLYENNPLAKEMFEKANEILGFRITDLMFAGTDEDLRQTKVTLPAVFLHSVISALCMGEDFKPEMTACHSLGEFSALVAAGALSFEDGLKLVYARAMAMQKACEAQPSTMAAIIALPDEKVEEICEAIS